MSGILIEEVDRKADKNWPGHMTTFKGTIEYAVKSDEGDDPSKVYIDYDFEEKYGRRRRSVTVYRKKSDPLAKLIGTDRWSVTKSLVWKLQHHGSKALVRDLRDKPEGYEQYDPIRFQHLVQGSGASACWGFKVPEDPARLIELGLIREKLSTGE